MNGVRLDRSQSSRKGKREGRKARVCTHVGVGRKSRASAQQHQDLFRPAELRAWAHPHPAATLLSQESQGIQGKHGKQQGALHGYQNLLN